MDKISNHRALLAGLALLFTLFLIIANYYIYNQQRNSLISSFENSQQTEVKILSQLARESLITENYALIEWFFNRWGKDHSAVVSLTLKNDNGFALSKYERPATPDTDIVSTSRIIKLHNENYHLTLASEMLMAKQLLNKLLQRLILTSSIAILLLGIIIWFLFQWYSIRPLVYEIKRREEAEHKIQQQHEFLQTVINGVNDSIMVINTNYEVELANDAARVSMNPSRFKTPRCYEVSHLRDTPCEGNDHPCPLQQVIETGEHAVTLHNHPDEDGNSRYFELLASPLFDSNGKLVSIVESSREMTSHIKRENELEEKQQHFNHLAHHDSLTGLPNRLLFIDRLEQAILRSKRTGDPFALLFIDLDQFKPINDSVGHAIGDEVLRQTALNLKKSVRADDTIARLGGDEFTIILSSFRNIDYINTVAQKVSHATQQPMEIEGNTYRLTSSIGISIFPQDADDSDTMIRNADIAMFKVKELGRNAYRFYSEDAPVN